MELAHYLAMLILISGMGHTAFGPKKLYSMDLPTTPVSVKIIGKDLLIVGPWYIGSVTNVHWKFRQPSRMTPRIVNKDIPNPRSVGRIPSNAFTGPKALTYWVATWGANDTNGAIYVMRPTTTYSVWKDITIDRGWNYERSQWIDMNKDGRVDCLTARFRGGVGQLLWFQQPKGQDKWGQQIIHEGMADGNFIGFVKGKKAYILIAGLQFSTLGLYWTLSRTNLWSNSRMVRHRVVDNYGKYYDVQYVDLNRDGRPDVLTTTVNVGNSRGHVLAYEVPNDLQNKEWKRRVLTAGFQGDYSPGRATAFWPNKWKRKTDRPSIFLSGAGQESLFILTPRPARTGWNYVKSTLRAGTGMIGIPYIADIDGDSYPEVFVPQGKKLHVFSYDYGAAVAEPPNKPASTKGKVTPRPIVKYLPPFYRPGMMQRNNRTGSSTIPRAGGLTGDAATRFGQSGQLPRAQNPGTVAPLGDLPPFRPRGGSSTNTGPRQPQVPANRPPSSPRNPSRNNVGTDNGGGGSQSPAGESSANAPGASNGGDLVLRPVMTNSGPIYVPVPNESASQNQDSPPQQNSNQVGYPPAENRSPAVVPWSGGTGLSQGQTSNNGQTSFGSSGGSSGNANAPRGQTNSNSQEIVPFSGTNNGGGSRIMSNSINPYQENPRGVSDTNRSPMEPVFEDEMETYDDYYSNYPNEYSNADNMYSEVETPLNLILSLTSESYRYQEEAADACTFENKVLCSLMQLESAVSAGPIPLVEWGWFDMPGRAAEIKDCVPGDVRWQGYKCHNGIIGHAPVQQAANLKGLCCSVLRGANITDRRYSNYHQAERGCLEMRQHICSLEEMHGIWKKSSYKSDAWGWYKNEGKLIKMVHYCIPQQRLWPGYECLSGRLVTSEIIADQVQESAYCCQDSSSKVIAQHNAIMLTLPVLIFVMLL